MMTRNSVGRAAEQLRMITLNRAKRLALDGIARVTGRDGRDLRFIDDETQCKRTGWIFRYEGRAAVETGQLAHAIGNTGPVIVTHKGVVHVFRDGRNVEESLADLEMYRAECTTQNRGP